MSKTACGDRFSGLARLENGIDGRHDTLLEPLAYTTRDSAWTIVIPAGFVTDYASIPRPLWVAIPPRGRYNRPAIVHDFLYQTAPIDPRTTHRCTWTTADAVLREACENVCTRATQRWVIWLGLRAGGWVTWRRYRARE